MATVMDIWTVVEPYLAAEHLELDDVELSGSGKGRVLRVLIDGEDVGIDRLAQVSRGLGRLLDNETDLEDSYQLEVSSPGLERKLRRPAHFMKSVGRQVKVKVSQGGVKATLLGALDEAGEKTFVVDVGQDRATVSYEDVLMARTVFTWEKAPKPGH